MTKKLSKDDIKKIRAKAFDPDFLLTCEGYDPDFILGNKARITLNSILPDSSKNLLPTVTGDKMGWLKYTGMTVLYNKKRKVPFVVAYNIDGAQKAQQADRPVFKEDPRIKNKNVQLNQAFYDLYKKSTEFEIGHMASNNEMGRGVDGILKAFQTFHFVNSVPQAERLNTGLWKGLESYVIKEASNVKGNKRICVFTGPILSSNDPAYRYDPDFQVPLLFYKVIVFLSSKGLYSTAFIMSHEKKLIEDELLIFPEARKMRGATAEMSFTSFPYKTVFQVNIPFLEEQTGLRFRWPGVKQLKVPTVIKQIEKIKKVSSAAEAREAMKTRGVQLVKTMTNDSVTERDLSSGRYQLNIELP